MPWKEKEAVNLREEFVLKAMGQTSSVSQLCGEYGISRKTGYKWMARFREQGLGGLRNASRKPARSPGALPEETVCELLRIKRGVPAAWGPKKVLAVYRRTHGEKDSPSLSSVKRVMEKVGLVTRRRRRSESPRRVQEGVKPEKPNEQWTVDFKGWWKTRDGARCEPLTIRDGYSRFLLDMRALEGVGHSDVRPAFERVFETYGLPASIRSDNGSPFASASSALGLSRLSAWWVALGIRLDRTDPGRPDQNGAHERIHRDIRAELQPDPAGCREESQAIFDEWRHTFNWERPHEALGMKMPGELYKASEAKYDASPCEIGYPASWLERRVDANGCIRLLGRVVVVSTALAGYVVGLEPAAGRLDVWFDYLRLGDLDLHAWKFNRVTEGPRGRPSPGRLAARGRGAPGRGNRQTTAKVLPMS